MDLGLKGKTALVTGADSGIGWHTAKALLAEGTTVIMSDLHAERLDAAAAKLDTSDGRLYHFPADVRVQADLDRLREQVEQSAGMIDILVQSSGIHGAGGMFHEIDDEGWHDTFETDLFGPVRLVRTFLPHLRAKGWGRVVLIASEDAVMAYPDELPYAAAKAGILSLAKGLSKTYARDGLLVNAVSPAFIHTPMTDEMMDKRAKEQGTTREDAIRSFLNEQRPHLELARRGEPEEVADVIAFLCSARASFVNGANWRIDGGSVPTMA